MARITHAEIVGTRMAEEGSGGYTVNSTSYSVLIFYSDGTVNLVEGGAAQIRPYLPFMRPRSGDFDQLKSMFEQLEARLETSIDKTVKSSINGILYESRNPLPKGITGKGKQEAKEILEKAGFKVEFSPTAPAYTNGIILECIRKENDPMVAVLKVKYDIPDVVGMNVDLAIQQLRRAGFSPTITRIRSEQSAENTVVYAAQQNDSMGVTVYVCKNERLEEDGFIEAMNSANSMIDIWKAWVDKGLGEKYPEIDKYIESKKEFERFYGRFKTLNEEKKKLRQFLDTAIRK